MGNRVQGIIRLSGQLINGQKVSCTGAQLVKILEALNGEINNCKWLIADIPLDNPSVLESLNDEQLVYMDDTKSLIDFSVNIDQYSSGIFLEFLVR